MTHPTLIQLRDADFIANLREVAENFDRLGISASPRRIIDLAMASKPKGYYVSFNSVVNRLYRRLPDKSGKSTLDTSSSPARRRHASDGLWSEIADEVSRYRLLHRDATIADAVNYIINFARPSRFYIPAKRARQLFRSSLARHYRPAI